MTRDVVIYGTGGHAREIHQTVEDVNQASPRFRFIGWLDDGANMTGRQFHGAPVVGGLDWLLSNPKIGVLMGIGSPAARCQVVGRLERIARLTFPTLIHPLAWVGNRVQIGEGTIVCAGTRLTTDVRIGRHVLLNTGCIVSHDCEIDDFGTIAPGVRVSGGVSVGEGADLGTGSTIIQGVHIGRWSVIGAGAVVIRDIPTNVTAVGVPAQVIKERPQGWQEGST